MARSRRHSYLLTHRAKAALTQAELAELLSVSADAVSKYELGKRRITVKVLIASAIIFGVGPAELFPALYDAVEDELAIRAHRLHERLSERKDPAAKKKVALLAGIPRRLRPATEV